MEKSVLPLPSDKDLKDLISQLPDDILVHMLSFLTLKEAVRTCVLSHRWKYLWPFFRGSLNFDDPDTMWDIADEKKKMKFERKKFIKRVNRILKLLRGSNLDEFRVCFEFDNNFKDLIDGWVDFAISKGVKRLELDFSPTEACEGAKSYTFTHDRFTSVETSVGVSCIKYLTSLTLLYVNVTGKLLEHILSNCPLLERLYVSQSTDLVNLKIWGSSLRLKYLHITQCIYFKSIEIYAPNLESFGLVGGIKETQVNYAPRLLDLHVGGPKPLQYAICPLSSYLSQLQSLVLNIWISRMQKLELPTIQTLTNLRHLTLRVLASDRESLIGLIPLIEAAPFLQKFTLVLSWGEPMIDRELRKVMKRPNKHLKEVEIIGFVGRPIDIDLTIYLLESAIKLEKIVITPRCPALLGTPWEFNQIEKNEHAIKAAKQLKKYLPRGAELLIL
ncbi:putative FBD-associated F-box protein At5g38570 [Quercus robur]|uniref:putative FBD-associated F-box protein At5g38570 n=1 Tax=Quercus robur TaxID=38942 RepID=UPI0021637495|nr:putative FBD-associated F-box protein At5g38570 [Quercus robur]XP_050256622.1 putative FBD-associated F-box protein At5g38570 [Quercus robur]XP_050256623.1 putative FBD-associated F-box protein At5g38570 [Quercus robur]XP_050256624.1 putative FBD-associated F-box protein At5g38570 [Quercus robur]XP_050256625.1 putative FBD-associated F-box protein At5g38570 [Quercus robur]